MKIIYSSLVVLIFLAGGFLFTGCQNADKFQDVLYFTGTENSATTRYSVEGPSEIGLSVTASRKVDSDIKISLKTTPELVEAYNKLNNKLYQPLPAGSYELSSSTLTMEAGENVSGRIRLIIKSLEDFQEGVTYCMPVSIVGAEGDLPVLEASRTIYIVINRTIITHAASLTSNYFKVPFSENAALASVPQVTMEARLYVHNFQSRNPFISSVMGIEENFLLRFGDVNIDKSQLQLAGGGYPITSNIQFETGKWYHVAVAYDGSQIKLYINGDLNGTVDAPRGNIDLTDSYSGGFHIGYSAGGRYLDGMISEVRVWTRALTQTELANNMCYVDIESAGLLAYWRFNEGEGSDVADWSGNGWHIKANRQVTWVEGVRCPD